MVRNLFLTTLCALAFCPAFAQTSTTEEKVEYSEDKYKVETNRFWSNWFISAGGGAQIYFGDHDKQVSFGKRLAPALDIAVGKWFTPGIGMRLMYSGLQQKGATQKGALSHSTGGDVPGKGGNGYWLEKQKFDMANFHADILFNFSNLFCGYNEKRIWNCSPYAGLGWARVWKSPSAKEVSANVGILNSFRLCSALDLNLDVRAMLVNRPVQDQAHVTQLAFLVEFLHFGKGTAVHSARTDDIDRQVGHPVDDHRIGNHTYSHQKGWGMSLERYIEDVDFANDLLHTELFRPPYARITPAQARALGKRYKLVMWDVLSRDYNRALSPRTCLRNVTRYLEGGSIVVFHDSEKSFRNMSYALPRTLQAVRDMGLKCKAIDL